MEKNNKDIVWVGKKDLKASPEFLENATSEFKEIPLTEDQMSSDATGPNRRDFLKVLGFGIGAATIAAGCDIPVKKAIPYVIKPEEIVPGVPTYYASSFVKGGDYEPETVVGADIVQSSGGRVEIVPLMEGFSTSNVIKQLSESNEDDSE